MLATAILAGIFLGCGDNITAAPYLPPLEVFIDDTVTKQATVTNDQNDSVTFNGSIYVYHSIDNRMVLNLSVAVDSKWECNVSPNQFVNLIEDIHYQFNVTIVVPQATLANVVGHVKVTAIMTGGDNPGTIYIDATVTVAPYYNITIVSDSLLKEIIPKEGTGFNFKVQNLGNVIDSYRFEIVNARDLEDAGWLVELSNKTSMGVPPKGEVNISVTVKSPQDWSWDLWIDRPALIILNTTSLNAKYNNMTLNQTISVHLDVKGYNNPLLEIITIIIITVVCITLVAINRRRRTRSLIASTKEKI